MIPENRGVSALPLAPSQTRASCALGALPAPQRPRQEHFRDLGVAPTARPTPDSLQGQEALLSNHVLCLRCRNGWQVISADRGAGAVGKDRLALTLERDLRVPASAFARLLHTAWTPR